MNFSSKTTFFRDIAFENIALGHFYFTQLFFLQSLPSLKDIVLKLPTRFEWPTAGKWVTPLFSGFKRIATVRFEPLVQDLGGVVTMEASLGGPFRTVILDYGDYPEVINGEALERSILYFKMQYLRKGYNDPRIIPGQYIPSETRLYSYLSWLRSGQRQKSIDVYGRFGTKFGKEIRSKAVGMLREQSYFKFMGDLKITRYSRYLREISASKICIDMPGNGPFCFRLIEYLALGGCVISPPHPTTLVPDLVDRVHIVYCKPDLSDLVELCRYYLATDGKREEIGRNAMTFFDANLSWKPLALYYLNAIRDALKTSVSQQ